MAVISVANTNALIDQLCSSYYKAYGTSGSGYGIGASGFGAYGAAATAVTNLAAIGDLDPAIDFGRALTAFRDSMVASDRLAERMRALLAAMDRHYSRFGGANYSSTESYLDYNNVGGGGTWTALQDRAWRTLYYAMRSTYPAASNIYFEVLQGTLSDASHLYTNGLGKFVASGAGTGTFTKAVVEGSLIDGGSTTGSIDSSKYCGGAGSLKVSGLTGTGNVTVTGIGFDPATETVTTSKTWITSVTANGDTVMTVGAGTAPANCLMIMVTNISIAAGISAGTIYVEAKRPSGRSLLS